ncbi:ornithine cyclodeaminase family protein [Williamsia soli]|uniref:ornithine cyclodeaminase family protein n=1 Tax=Williamsia soli TaxID=364929 RepID=UPI0027DD9514|nr:hypothetical protein [Williamsia soli]
MKPRVCEGNRRTVLARSSRSCRFELIGQPRQAGGIHAFGSESGGEGRPRRSSPFEHARAICAVRPIDKLLVWSRSAATVDRFRERTTGLDVQIEYAESPRRVVSAADVVCTLTPSQTPIIEGAWFQPGLHVNAVGAPPRPDHREIDGPGMADCRLIVDSTATALSKSGEVLLAIAEGYLTADDVRVELGDVIVAPQTGRRSDDEVTLFNSVGIGLQDLVTAHALLDAAAAQGAGSTVLLNA